jgi:hypothetical protein
MAPPVDHFQICRGAQLLVPMLDDAVLQPGLSRRQAEEDIVVYPELGADPARAVLEEILWRRRSGISLGTPLATSPPHYRADGVKRAEPIVDET